MDSYGLEVTTLEEVFLAVSAAVAADAKAGQPRLPGPAADAQKAEQEEVTVDVDGLSGGAGSRVNEAKGSQASVTLLRVCPAAFCVHHPSRTL